MANSPIPDIDDAVLDGKQVSFDIVLGTVAGGADSCTAAGS